MPPAVCPCVCRASRAHSQPRKRHIVARAAKTIATARAKSLFVPSALEARTRLAAPRERALAVPNVARGRRATVRASPASVLLAHTLSETRAFAILATVEGSLLARVRPVATIAPPVSYGARAIHGRMLS